MSHVRLPALALALWIIGCGDDSTGGGGSTPEEQGCGPECMATCDSKAAHATACDGSFSDARREDCEYYVGKETVACKVAVRAWVECWDTNTCAFDGCAAEGDAAGEACEDEVLFKIAD